MARTEHDGDDARDALLREAANWFTRIHDEAATTEDFLAWQQWLAGSARNLLAFREVEDLWRDVGDIARPPWPSAEDMSRDAYTGAQPVATWSGSRKAMSGWRSARLRSLIVVAATVSVVVIGTAMLMRHPAWTSTVPDVVVLTTSRAEDREVSLSDGSQVTLGAQSRLDVDMTSTARNVAVDSGEAFFKVAHETRPFVVRAGNGTITALGTAFNVRAHEGRVVVTVTEGRVKVTDRAGNEGGAEAVTYLGAGEQMTYERVTKAVRAVDPTIATAWRSGRLKYLNEPLRFVIPDVARYTRRQIIVADSSVGEMLYTGTVLPGELDDWLTSVSRAFPVDVQRTSDAIVLKSRAAARP